MIPNKTPGEELRFGADFTARVFREVDAIIAQRRRAKWMTAAVSVVLLAIGIAAGLSRMQPLQTSIPEPNSAIVASADLGASLPQGSGSEPMDYMFPDAAPLARFADEYSEAADGGAGNRQDMFFADEAEESGAM